MYLMVAEPLIPPPIPVTGAVNVGQFSVRLPTV